MGPPADDLDNAPSSDDIDATVAALYAGPPDEFVAGRDALVRSLRAAKRRDDANVVKALRKPKAVARALNAANMHDPGAVADLVRAAGAVTDAQEGGSDVRAALDELRAAEGRVAEVAVATASGDDRGVDATAVSAAVRAVLADADGLAALQRGRLVDVPSGGGFGTFGLGGLAPPAVATEEGTTPAPAPGRAGGTKAGDRHRTRKDRSTDRSSATTADAGTRTAASGRKATTASASTAGRTEPRAVVTARRDVADAEEALQLATEALDQIAPAVDEAEAAEQAARDEADAAARAAEDTRARALEVARQATAARREAAALARRRDQAAAKLDKARARLAKAEGT